jgi:hypothetical protein
VTEIGTVLNLKWYNIYTFSLKEKGAVLLEMLKYEQLVSLTSLIRMPCFSSAL